jgi:23S rRNA pseudouridine1911/1915/1917 synthase
VEGARDAVTGETVRLTVPGDASGSRLDVFLAAHVPERSRSSLRRLILDGKVRVDGRAASKPALSLDAGAEVEVFLAPPLPATPQPETIPVEVAYEDEHLVVVLKPAGLVVHPGHGSRSGTLVNALLGRGTPLAPAGGAERPGIVHRLDRETSGLLVVAKTDAAHRALVAAFAHREVRKTYLALVWGHPDPAAGTIERAIGRSRSDPTKMSVAARRSRSAITSYRTVERMQGFAMLEVDLVTGRTHQIRVHFESLRHPIVGDTRYGGRPEKNLRDPAKRAAILGFHRLALHAARLAFAHPASGAPLAFDAPLPADVEGLLAVLRREP